MDLINASSNSTPQTAKERMREKIFGTLKAAKLKTTLAAKIKSKNLNNSSILKISLKHNNRALACALTAEKEKARSLESDKMILQKEVKMLHFQNALLRQNLSIVNSMLKDIEVFMNINLPAAIEISNISESTDLLATEERKSSRFSRESRLSVDELEGYRLTGMALRVPFSSTEQQKCSDVPEVLRNEDEHLIAPQSTDSSTAKEKSYEQHEIEMNTSLLTSKERYSTYNKNVTSDSSLNMKVNSELPLDEDLTKSGRSGGGFVTRRKKRSTASRSSTQSVNSDFNQSKNSLGIGRESYCNTQWEIKHDNFPPKPEHSAIPAENALHFDLLMRKDTVLGMSCSPLSLNPDKNFHAKKDNKNTQLDIETTHQPDMVHSEACDLHPIDDRPVEQEKTVYEADMEMTYSDSAAIVAVIPKRKMKTSKSNIPVKQNGTSLRKVKKTAHEKTNRSSSKGKGKSDPSKSKEQMDISLNIDNNVPLEFNPPADFKPDSFDRYDCRRTFVLPGSANKDKTNVYESETKPDPGKNEAKPSVVCSVEESFTENLDENIPMDFKPNSTYSRRTFVLPGPENEDKIKVFESKTKLYPGKNKTKPSVVCSVEESFIGRIDKNLSLEFKPPEDFRQDSTDQCNSRRTYVLPHPVKQDKTFVLGTQTKLYPDEKEFKPSVVCGVEESFTETSCDANCDLVFAAGNLPSSDVEYSTNKTVVKRKSKISKRPTKDTEKSKKKRKITKNLRAVEHIGEAEDSQISNELDNVKINYTIPSSSMESEAPHIRRETYVLSSIKSKCVLSEFIPRDNGINCRRETFVIPDPNCLKSASEEYVDSLDHPLQSLKSTVSKDVQLGTENVESNIVSHGLDADFNKPIGFRKSKCKQINQNERSTNVFSQVDKRKTRVLARNQNDFSKDKDMLVRESCVTITQSQFNRPTKFLNAAMANEQDSFMLDMVSESILDETLDSPSFVEFPSTTNQESASMYNVSLNNIPLLDPPVSEEHVTKENEQLNASKSLEILDENEYGLVQEFGIERNECCKVENQSMENNEADIKPFQDLTNKTHDLSKQPPKSSSENQEEAQVFTRRRRNAVNYKEPSLGKKLRREGTEFLNTPVSKGTGKKKGGRKKNIKLEECPTNSM
ncbi:shugoshin 2 [Mantella aurantiaca]